MKNIFYISILLFAFGAFAQAATRGDVKVIEASENIRYLSQKIAKDYLLFYQYPEQVELKNKLTRELQLLSEDLRIIATTTKDSDTKDILEFLAYSKDQIAEMFEEKADKEKAALMLDYSETLLEGADSIARAHKYDFSKEEKMLMLTKKIEYILERITKYYMALNVGFQNTTNSEQLHKAMTDMEESLLEMSLYAYPQEPEVKRRNLDKYWSVNRVFFNKSDTLFIPKLMFNSVAYLESIVSDLALYHSKNQ